MIKDWNGKKLTAKQAARALLEEALWTKLEFWGETALQEKMTEKEMIEIDRLMRVDILRTTAKWGL